MANDIIVSEMTSASQINTNDLMIMTQPDLLAETGYSTKKGTVLQVANKMLKGTEYLTDLPDFTDKTVLGGLEELKGDLTALLPVNTASGAIANFDTDLSLPLVSCKANIVASQASGTPTPSNPLPISGYTEANITRCGVNFAKSISVTPTQTQYYSVLYVECELKPDTTYTLSFSGVNGNSYYTNSSIVTSVQYSITVTGERTTVTFTTKSTISKDDATAYSSGRGWILLKNYITQPNENAFSDVQLEQGSSATSYNAYNGQTYAIAFGQTVYGGVLDVTRGKLTVTHGYAEFDGSPDENWSIIGASYRAYIAVSDIITNIADNVIGDILCNCYPAGSYTGMNTSRITYRNGITQINIFDYDNITTEENWRTQLSNTPLQVVYELATPFDIDLTPVQINALIGVNNIYNDTNGDTEVKYKEGIQHYIDKKIAATQALIL